MPGGNGLRIFDWRGRIGFLRNAGMAFFEKKWLTNFPFFDIPPMDYIAVW